MVVVFEERMRWKLLVMINTLEDIGASIVSLNFANEHWHLFVRLPSDWSEKNARGRVMDVLNATPPPRTAAA